MDLTEERSADEALAALSAHTQKSGAQAADAVCTCVKVKGGD